MLAAPSALVAVLPLLAPAAPADVSADLEAIRERHALPALAGLLIEGGEVAAVGASGVRAAGSDEPARADDVWHLGSCTKAMTATLLATLVADGTLAWETTLAEALPDLREAMHEGLRGVTLRQLVRHEAGLATGGPPGLFVRLAVAERSGELTTAEARRRFVEETLAAGPSGEIGAFAYANAGYVIAGHVAERATGRSWEDLMRERVFGPLGMASAGFGPPGAAEEDPPATPRGHTPEGRAIPPGPGADNPGFLGPAGTVHASLQDWARFVAAHLRGADLAEGERDALGLSAADYRELHAPGDGEAGNAAGWLVMRRAWAAGAGEASGPVLTHAGSNTMWFCVVWAAPGTDAAALVVTNIAGPAAPAATDEAAGVLLHRFRGE